MKILIFRLAILAARFLVVFNHFRICKICCSSTYHHELQYIKENTTTKLHAASPEILEQAINFPCYF